MICQGSLYVGLRAVLRRERPLRGPWCCVRRCGTCFSALSARWSASVTLCSSSCICRTQAFGSPSLPLYPLSPRPLPAPSGGTAVGLPARLKGSAGEPVAKVPPGTSTEGREPQKKPRTGVSLGSPEGSSGIVNRAEGSGFKRNSTGPRTIYRNYEWIYRESFWFASLCGSNSTAQRSAVTAAGKPSSNRKKEEGQIPSWRLRQERRPEGPLASVRDERPQTASPPVPKEPALRAQTDYSGDLTPADTGGRQWRPPMAVWRRSIRAERQSRGRRPSAPLFCSEDGPTGTAGEAASGPAQLLLLI